MVTTDYL